MSRNAYSFRIVQRHPYRRDVRIGLYVVFAATLAIFFLLEALKFAGIISLSGSADSRYLHGAVLERVSDENVVPFDADVMFLFENDAAFFAAPGQKGVPLFSFTLSPRKASKLQRLVFSHGNNVDTDDIESLRLFIHGEFVSEKPFFEGRAVFDGLHLRLHPGEEVWIEVTGRVSQDARAGHRIQIGLVEVGDVLVQSIVSEVLTTDIRFPVWSPAVSIIGNRL